MNCGVYFTKRTADKIKDFFKIKKYIENKILILVNPDEKPEIGAQDVYYLLYRKKQKPNTYNVFTKDKAKVIKIFTTGKLLKKEKGRADGVIGNERADLYLLKDEFGSFEDLKSEGYEWPIVLANDANEFKTILKNKSRVLSLADVLQDMKEP
jgi:hypothetical protein